MFGEKIIAEWPKIFSAVVMVLFHDLRSLLGHVTCLLLSLLPISLFRGECLRDRNHGVKIPT